MQSIYLRRIYFLIAIVAFFVCWYQNLAYLHFGMVNGTWQFIQDTMVNPASRSITFDIAFFYLSALIFMIVEARRLKIAYVWAYIIFGFAIAISVTFPIFLIAREKKIQTKA